MVIVGEAGIGKSRLLAEVATEATAARGACRCWAGATRASRSCHSGPGWMPSARGGVIDDEVLLAQLNPSWRAELGGLVAGASGERQAAPTGDRLRLFESVLHVVERLAAAQPTLLGLEDLHWADDMSLRLLAFVTRRIRAAPVMIVATVREDEPASARGVAHRRRGARVERRM